MSRLTIERILSHIRTPLYKNAYALIFSSTTSSILGLVYWVLAARLYPPEVVGLSSALISALLFLAGLAQLSLNNVIVRFLPLAGRSTYRLVVYSYLVALLMAALMSTIFLLGLDTWAPVMRYIGSSIQWSFNFTIAVMAWCIFALQDSVLTGMRQAVWVPVENTIYSLTKIVLLVGLALPLQAEGIFASWVIPVLLSLLPINFLVFRRLIPRHIQISSGNSRFILLSDVVKFIFGNYLGSLFFLASTSLLPIIVTNRLGASANAYFYPAWTIAAGLQFIANNLSTSLTVEASIDQANLISYSRRVLVHTVRLLVPVVIVVLLGAHFILGIFGESYADEGTTLLRLLALGMLPNILNTLSISLARIQHHAILVSLIQGALCVLTLGLSLILLPLMGINGVGLGWLISQAVVAIYLVTTLLWPVLQ